MCACAALTLCSRRNHWENSATKFSLESGNGGRDLCTTNKSFIESEVFAQVRPASLHSYLVFVCWIWLLSNMFHPSSYPSILDIFKCWMRLRSLVSSVLCYDQTIFMSVCPFVYGMTVKYVDDKHLTVRSLMSIWLELCCIVFVSDFHNSILFGITMFDGSSSRRRRRCRGLAVWMVLAGCFLFGSFFFSFHFFLVFCGGVK